MSSRLYLPALGIINALGCGADEVAQGLFSGDTRGMLLLDGWLSAGTARIGRVRAELPEIPPFLSVFACHRFVVNVSFAC